MRLSALCGARTLVLGAILAWGGHGLAAPPAWAMEHALWTEGGDLGETPPLSVVVHQDTALLDLAPGWKTYGPDPGPFGYPPSIEAVAAENVASWQTVWPESAPQDSFGVPFEGYDADLSVRIAAQPVVPSLPMRLHLVWDVAACNRVCVPSSWDTVFMWP